MLIGLGYRARVGKDTATDFMVKELGFKKTAFAYSLKEAVKIVFGWTDDHVYGHLKEVTDPFWNQTPREVMQKFGTDALRNNLRQDIWVKSVEKQISDDQDWDWVITDVRFPNEADFIHNLGGLVFRIDRTNPDEIAAGTSNHSSETAMDKYEKWDSIISNNGTIDSFYQKLNSHIQLYREI